MGASYFQDKVVIITGALYQLQRRPLVNSPVREKAVEDGK